MKIYKGFTDLSVGSKVKRRNLIFHNHFLLCLYLSLCYVEHFLSKLAYSKY